MFLIRFSDDKCMKIVRHGKGRILFFRPLDAAACRSALPSQQSPVAQRGQPPPVSYRTNWSFMPKEPEFGAERSAGIVRSYLFLLGQCQTFSTHCVDNSKAPKWLSYGKKPIIWSQNKEQERLILFIFLAESTFPLPKKTYICEGDIPEKKLWI